MRRARTRRTDYDVDLSSFCSPATILAVLLILAVSSRFSGTGAAAEEKTPPTLDQASLRYLPDGCRVVGQANMDALLKSELGLTMAASVRNDGQFAPLDLQLEHVEKAVLGARAFAEGNAAQYVYALFCKQPVKQLAVTSPWVAEQVAQHTVWTKPEKDGRAVCVVEDRIVLIGAPQVVRAVLLRDGPAELSPVLEKACKQLSGDADATVTLLPTDDVFPANSFGISDMGELSKRVDAVNVEVDFGVDLAMRVAAICRDEAAAQQLNGMGLALWALVRSQGIEQQDPKAQRLLRSLKCHVEGPILNVSMVLPFEMIQAGNSTTPNAIVPVQHLAAPTKFALSPGHAVPTATYPGTVITPTSSPPTAMPYQTVPPPGVILPSPPPATGWDPYASGSPPTSSMSAYPHPPGSPYGTTPPPTPGYSSGPQFIVPPKPKPALPVIELSDVIRLSEAGVDEEVIARHLSRRRLKSVLTADDLILLTERGVSTTLIQTVQVLDERVPPSVPRKAHPGKPASYAPPNTPHVIR